MKKEKPRINLVEVVVLIAALVLLGMFSHLCQRPG